jgi:hypothetical protein
MSGVFRNIDSPTPSLPGECVPPAFGAGGGHTHWVERGWGVNILEEARHSSVLYICKYFVVGNIPVQNYALLALSSFALFLQSKFAVFLPPKKLPFQLLKSTRCSVLRRIFLMIFCLLNFCTFYANHFCQENIYHRTPPASIPLVLQGCLAKG